MKYIGGEIVKKTVLVDQNEKAIIKPISIGLTIENISAMRGGKATMEGIMGLTYLPMQVRTVLEDNKRKFYDLYEGVYTVYFNQTLKQIPEDVMFTIESSPDLTKTGAYIVPEKHLNYHSMGNLSALLMIPFSCHITFEIGTNIADLYMTTIQEV